jgi:hypothetical protein
MLVKLAASQLGREEFPYILEHSGATLVVTDSGHAGDVAPLVEAEESLQVSVLGPG